MTGRVWEAPEWSFSDTGEHEGDACHSRDFEKL